MAVTSHGYGPSTQHPEIKKKGYGSGENENEKLIARVFKCEMYSVVKKAEKLCTANAFSVVGKLLSHSSWFVSCFTFWTYAG